MMLRSDPKTWEKETNNMYIRYTNIIILSYNNNIINIYRTRLP